MRKNKILKIFMIILLLVSLEASVIAASIGVVNKDTVRVRAKATTDSGIVALVSIGDKVTIIGEDGDWYKVKAKDEDGDMKTGYIRKDLLNVDGKTSTVTPTEPEENKEQDEPEKPVDESNNSSGENEKIKEEIPEEPSDNEETPVEGSEGEITKQPAETVVERNDISIDTIKKSANLSDGSKLQLTENTKIKILPSANSRNIVELQANTEVTILEIINSWCRVENAEGACGWVRIDQ